MTTGVPAYSTTPANNVNANTGVNWDEGMSPGAVNNSARANMSDLRSFANDLIWFQYGSGTSPVVTPAYASGTSFTVAGIDVTAVYHAGRRVKAVGSGTGTIYGSISSSSFSTNTTVNMTWDSGSLTNEALTIYLSQMPVTGKPSSSAAMADITSGTWTPTDASGASLSLSSVNGYYRRVGNVVHCWGAVTYPTTGDTTAAKIGGLPFTAAAIATNAMLGIGAGLSDLMPIVNPNTTNFSLKNSLRQTFHNNEASAVEIDFSFSYPI